MKTFLILGGSQQIGRLLVEKLLETRQNDFEIFIFNRGKTNPELFENTPFVTKIIGDRNTDDIQKIFNRDYDVVFDFSCYWPASLKEIIGGLKGRVGRYIFVSTISVYDYKKNIGKNELIDENYDLLDYTEEQINAEGLKFYAQKKIASENYLRESSLDNIILRPHFIYGKYDWQNLDYYWINRIKKYDQILMPDGGNDLIHRTYIDDFVRILIRLAKVKKHRGTYNVTTHNPISLKDYLNALCQILGKESTNLVSVNTKKLVENNVRPIIDLPLWSQGSHFVFSNKKLNTDFEINYTSHFQSLKETCDWNKFIENKKEGKSKWEDGGFGLLRDKELLLIKN